MIRGEKVSVRVPRAPDSIATSSRRRTPVAVMVDAAQVNHAYNCVNHHPDITACLDLIWATLVSGDGLIVNDKGCRCQFTEIGQQYVKRHLETFLHQSMKSIASVGLVAVHFETDATTGIPYPIALTPELGFFVAESHGPTVRYAWYTWEAGACTSTTTRPANQYQMFDNKYERPVTKLVAEVQQTQQFPGKRNPRVLVLDNFGMSPTRGGQLVTPISTLRDLINRNELHQELMTRVLQRRAQTSTITEDTTPPQLLEELSDRVREFTSLQTPYTRNDGQTGTRRTDLTTDAERRAALRYIQEQQLACESRGLQSPFNADIERAARANAVLESRENDSAATTTTVGGICNVTEFLNLPVGRRATSTTHPSIAEFDRAVAQSNTQMRHAVHAALHVPEAFLYSERQTSVQAGVEMLNRTLRQCVRYWNSVLSHVANVVWQLMFGRAEIRSRLYSSLRYQQRLKIEDPTPEQIAKTVKIATSLIGEYASDVQRRAFSFSINMERPPLDFYKELRRLGVLNQQNMVTAIAEAYNIPAHTLETTPLPTNPPKIKRRKSTADVEKMDEE